MLKSELKSLAVSNTGLRVECVQFGRAPKQWVSAVLFDHLV